MAVNRIVCLSLTRSRAVRRGVALSLGLSLFVSWTGASTAVYENGRIALPVTLAQSADPMEQAAANELARVLGVMSGEDWPVVTEGGGPSPGIYVGSTREARRWGPPLVPASDLLRPGPGEVGPDAFRIRFREGSVLVEGATPEANRYAVSWMLQRWAGARWYAAGKLGEVIPRRTSLAFPSTDVERQPGYLSREIYGLDGAVGAEWAVRNGLAARFEFSHALSQVFPRPLLEAYPQWQPELFGRRYLPADEKDFHWQPNLAQADLAEVAAHQASRAFEENPQRRSFSLGINDSVRFDQGEATRALVEPLRFFRGMPDYSQLVFTFMNRVAENLGTTHPGRYLGCLAYFWCENTPPHSVHPRVLPYLTTDRGQYYNAQYRLDDLALMSRWAASGVSGFGLWEYAYGRGFVVPRAPHQLLADGIQEGWKRGARGYFSEVGPHPGFDAFKVWMIATLLWEPERSYDSLAEEFFTGYYGGAARSMRAFFELAEKQWQNQSGPPYWIKYYQHEDQALLFPSDVVAAMRTHLDTAATLAAPDAFVSARIAQTDQAFALTEAFLAFDQLRRELANAAGRSDDAQLTDMELWANKLSQYLARRDDVYRAFANARRGPEPAVADFDLVHYTRNDPVPRLLWEAAHRNSGSAGRMLQLAGSRAGRETMWTTFADVLDTSDRRTWTLISTNSHFEQQADAGQEPRFLYARFGSIPADWIIRAAPTERGSVAVVAGTNQTAAKRLRIEGAWDTQVFQWHRVMDRSSYFACARMRGRVSPGNDSGLFLTFLGEDQKPMGLHRMQSLPKGDGAEDCLLVLADEPPVGAVWVGVGVAASRQVEEDWLEVASVELTRVPKPAE